jgi:hypothetical protein
VEIGVDIAELKDSMQPSSDVIAAVLTRSEIRCEQAGNKIAQIVFAEESGRLMRSLRNAIVIGFAIGLGLGQARAGEFDSILRWRNIGPYRGGRTRAIAGVPSQPNVFYMSPVNGGVFKSIDYGRTWQPIFDDQPTASIGAIAVAPSDPNIVYVGSGEGLHRPDLSVGDGIYKSSDAGRTWTHLGLRDGQQIAQLVVDPKNPDRIFVAVAGHPYGPNEERGIYRSLDGGKTFEKVLYRDENVGGSDVQIDPSNSQVVFAALWDSREGPWENGVFNGDGGGIFKSTDGGKAWQQLTKGLPGNMVQANLAIAPRRRKHCSPRSGQKRSRNSIARTTPAKPGVEQLMIRGRDLESAVAISPWCGLIQKILKSFTRPAWFVGNRRTAAKPGTAGAAHPAATIIKTFGSIRTIPTSFFSVRTRVRSSL